LKIQKLLAKTSYSR